MFFRRYTFCQCCFQRACKRNDRGCPINFLFEAICIFFLMYIDVCCMCINRASSVQAPDSVSSLADVPAPNLTGPGPVPGSGCALHYRCLIFSGKQHPVQGILFFLYVADLSRAQCSVLTYLLGKLFRNTR